MYVCIYICIVIKKKPAVPHLISCDLFQRCGGLVFLSMMCMKIETFYVSITANMVVCGISFGDVYLLCTYNRGIRIFSLYMSVSSN